MNKTTFTVYGKELQFDSDFVRFYKDHTFTELEEMAHGFLCAEYKTPDISEIILEKTPEELSEIVMSWALADLETMGVVYREFKKEDISMNKSTITVYGRTLEFDTDFLNFYKEKTTTSLEEMAVGFLAGEYNEECNCDVEKRSELIATKTTEELEQVLMKWAMFDLKCINATYSQSNN